MTSTQEKVAGIISFIVAFFLTKACLSVSACAPAQVQTACGVVDVAEVACDHLIVRVHDKDGTTRTVRVELDGGADR
jgi:hypothetical protein